MRKIIKNISIFIIVFAMFTMVGCGKKEVTSVTETVNILMNTFTFKEVENSEKIGMTVEDVKTTQEALKSTYKNMFEQMFKSLGANVSDEEISSFIDSFIKMLGKVTFSVEEGEQSGNTKNVKINFNAINLAEILDKAVEETKNDPNFSKDTFMKIYVEKLKQNFDLAEPSLEETLDWEFELIEDKNFSAWMPIDETNFGVKIGSMLLKQ